MSLEEILSLPQTPNKPFTVNDKVLDFKLVDFWQWNQSDLIENRNRGILAEFLVMKALDIKSRTRMEWDAFDLETDAGVKIEVKSAAYIQAWKQAKYSTISFGVAPTKTLLNDNNYSKELKRHADVYVFCLLHHKKQETINPMDMEQWTFYLVKTSILDAYNPKQKSIGLSSIESLEHIKCNYGNLKANFSHLVM